MEIAWWSAVAGLLLIVMALSDSLLARGAFRDALLGSQPVHATLAYGQPIEVC